MKTPRTLLNQLEEAGCRLAGVVGTRSGELLLSEDPKINLDLAQQFRNSNWEVPELTHAMNALASRIERRFCPGPVKFDRNGFFMKSDGQLVRTKETQALAKAFYESRETTSAV